ncbi:MAG TPA: DUF2752 domain-containing protein [Pyrinomonadaceae bacterium]|jgi:hypothetical protein|nr:DUF2752 domain-containing protein [Pyrinomonadaceae bacterium]
MRDEVNFHGEDGASASSRRLAWATWLGLSTMFAVSAVWHPSDDGIILCPFRAVTGYPCPGCGMTRAFSAIAHGDIWRAVIYNPLSPFLFLALLLVWANAAATLLNWRGVHSRLARLRPSANASAVMLFVLLAWWVVRLVGGF